jgi:hypothetical protein
MNATSVDIKDILVSEGGFEFGVDLFISTQPPTPVNCVTLFDTSTSPADGTIDGNKVFFQESLMIWVRNSDYEAAYTQCQAIIGLLHNRAGFTQNETFYLYSSLQSGPNNLTEDEDNFILTLNFNLQRKSGIVPASVFLTFAKLVAALVGGTDVELSVDETNETIIINNTADAAVVYMRSNGTYIQYSNDYSTWYNIIAVADLKGEQGEQGIQGIQGVQGIPGATGVTVIQDADDVDKTDVGEDKLLVSKSDGEGGFKHIYEEKQIIPTKTSELTNDSEFITDAPADDVTYGRKNNTWVEAGGGSGGGDSFQTLTDAASITWDVSSGNKASVTITDNRQFANPTNLAAGQTLVLHCTQDATGSRVPTFGSYFKFPGTLVPTPSSTGSSTDIYEFEVVSTTAIRLTNFIKGY